MSDSHSSVGLVILNWNGVADTLACLASLRSSTEPVHAIVVDNGSTGSDVEQIRASGLADTLLETGLNLGYAEGNNRGLQWALDHWPEFPMIGVLNNDTTVEAGCIENLVEQLDRRGNRLMALAPIMVHAEDPSRAWFAGGVVERGWARHLGAQELSLDGVEVVPSAWLTGCCILAPRATWQEVGLFDVRYYLEYEDVEWSRRARDHGVVLGVATGSRIAHKVSRSFGSSASAPSPLQMFYFIRNGLRYGFAYERRHLHQFVLDWLIRPTVSALQSRNLTPQLVFSWLGALAYLARSRGPAPSTIIRFDQWRQHRLDVRSRS